MKDERQKRCHAHDYRKPCMYLVTVTVAGRERLLGRLTGDTQRASVELTAVGKAVEHELWEIPRRYPQVRLMQYQIMPDHVHAILWVTQELPEGLPLGNVVAAWKTACGKAYSSIWGLKATTPDTHLTGGPTATKEDGRASGEAALRSPKGSKPAYRALFAPGFNDSILLGKQQLNHMMAYVRDNPRRLLVKQQHRGFFAIRRGIAIAGTTFDAVGNLDLLQRPLLAIHCRRRWTDDELTAYHASRLAAAQAGTVLVGAFISKNKKEILHAAQTQHLPVIHLVENGLNDLYKPVGRDFDACAEGRLLILAPWSYHNDTRTISREQCQQLNAMAEAIASARHQCKAS